MNNLLKAIDDAIKNENWLAALFLSISIPDICGGLEEPSAPNGKRYKEWYLKYIQVCYPNFTPENCWKLRNACLHQCSDRTTKQIFSRVHFIAPEKGLFIHNNTINDVLQLQIDIFCNDFCEGTNKWLDDMKNNSEVTIRIKELMQVHPISSLSFIKFT